jgi:hypothetical protein
MTKAFTINRTPVGFRISVENGENMSVHYGKTVAEVLAPAFRALSMGESTRTRLAFFIIDRFSNLCELVDVEFDATGAAVHALFGGFTIAAVHISETGILPLYL